MADDRGTYFYKKKKYIYFLHLLAALSRKKKKETGVLDRRGKRENCNIKCSRNYYCLSVCTFAEKKMLIV